MREFDLRELQLCELDVLKEFIRICDKYQLCYYVAWGTLLGTIRHKGFIPWDDDIDVCMPWDDYCKFKLACEQEHNDDYAYEDWFQHHDYYLYWAKLRKNNTTCMTRSESNLDIHWGVGIDIFPLFPFDSSTLSKKESYLFKFMDFVVKRSYLPFKADGFSKNIKKSLYHLYPKSLDEKTVQYCMHELGKNPNQALYLYDLSEKQGILPIEAYGKGVMKPFEDIMVRCPHDYDQYLSHMYGTNYMMIPKEENRIDHGDIIVDTHTDYRVMKEKLK